MSLTKFKIHPAIGGIKLKAGFSLIEMIIVVSILGLIAVISSGFLLVSLMASNKAEATKEVRQNGNYALSVIEGLILNSTSVGCTGVSNEEIWTKDLENNLATVIFDSASKRIASFSGSLGVATSTYLTGSNVTVSDCIFTCVQDPGRPAKVVINFAVSKGGSGARPSEKASLQFQTTVVTKNY